MMINKIYVYGMAVLSVLVLSQCTKKAGELTQTASTDIHSWRSSAPDAADARDIMLGDYTSFDLDNGLKVIVVQNTKIPRVSYQLSLKHDPVIEGQKAGLSGFAGDMMSKGTKNKSKSEIDEAVDYLGANLNTSANGIFASSLKKHSTKLLDIMTDILYQPTFPEEEFEKIIKRSLSGLATVKTSADAIAANVNSVVNYGTQHPYGDVETEESIKNITVEDCKNYVDTYFKPNNAFLVIVGDITIEEARQQAQKYFGPWKKGVIPISSYNLPQRPTGSQVRFAEKEGAVQSLINITYPVDLKPGAQDGIAASLMNSILGGGIFSGRLMQNLRESKGYTYGARSRLESDDLVGNFLAFANVGNMVTDSALTEFIYEMRRMVSEPVSDEDIDLAKSGLSGNFARSLESPQTIARFALNTFKYNLPGDYYRNYLKNVDATTKEDIQMAAKKFILPDNMNIVVVGNKGEVAEKLNVFDADGKIDYYDAFGRKIEAPTIGIPAGLKAQDVIDTYLNAIGGKDRLKGVTSLKTSMKANLGGREAVMEVVKIQSGKFLMQMKMSGMVLQETKFDGNRGVQSMMGNTQEVEGDDLNDLKKQTAFFDQLTYDDPAYTLDIESVENVDGQMCYKINIAHSDGDKSIEFYDIKSGLLVRSVSNSLQGTVSNEYKDYKEVNGIRMPHTITISGAMPVPITMEATSINVNENIDDTIFSIE